MKLRIRLPLWLLVFGIAAVIPLRATPPGHGRAITFDDLIAMHRVSDPQVSPDGKWVAYSIATPDREANHPVSNIWLVAVTGGAPQQLSRGGSDSRPRWAPDSQRLAFLSERDGTSQVYVISLAGGEALPVTSIATGADNELWSPDGKSLAFTSRVYPDCGDEGCNRERMTARQKSKVKARIYERLLYRHWTSWWDGTRSHLFIASVESNPATARPSAQSAPARDLTPGADYDVPPFSLGGPDDIAFSPDGKELCFAADPGKDEALSTNRDLFLVPVDGSKPPERITTNPADDRAPAYSPDGKWIAYRAQKRPGYESDRWRLMLYDRYTGRPVSLTEEFDRSVEFAAWSADSKTIYFPAEDRGQMPIFSIGVGGGTPKAIVANSFNPELTTSNDGKTLVFSRNSMTQPTEIFAANADGTSVRQLTHHNAARLAELDLPAGESFWFEGAESAHVHGFLLRPAGFDASKKYPLLLLVHGGPQGAWGDDWFYRWNPQVMASSGYVVAMVNPRGSTGYGQKFTDEINNDWGGKVYVDLMKGVDYLLAKYPFVDGSRIAAAGGSYGGYMMDWFESHAQGRFKCLISHAGDYDLESSYGATEELWFAEWELRGTPWTNPAAYDRWSPLKFAKDFAKYKTPVLVIAGELDFRVPYTQSLEMFTALQRQGVPSKLLIFPDEGHWILKPQNSELWYKTFLGWLAVYLK